MAPGWCLDLGGLEEAEEAEVTEVETVASTLTSTTNPPAGQVLDLDLEADGGGMGRRSSSSSSASTSIMASGVALVVARAIGSGVVEAVPAEAVEDQEPESRGLWSRHSSRDMWLRRRPRGETGMAMGSLVMAEEEEESGEEDGEEGEEGTNLLLPDIIIQKNNFFCLFL